MKMLPLLLGASPITALTATQLFQFPNTSQFVENIAVRSNGHLLLDTFDHGRLYTLDPTAKKPIPRVVAQVPESTGLTGIAEVAHDLYAVSAGILNLTDDSFEAGTSKVALVDLRDCHDGKLASVRVIAEVADAGILNGMASLQKHKHIILSVDSKTGRVYRVNTRNGKVDIAFQDDRLKPGPGPVLVPLGINGVKIFKGYLYLTNSQQRFVGRIKIDDFGDKTGDLEIITTLPLNPPKVPDDFSIAKDGTIYLGAHVDTLVKITPNGQWTALVEGSSAGFYLDGPTSTALSKDEKTVYVTTSGGGQTGKGGQIVAVHL
ncbi:six-bladed beta-propeller, TolB-like protein [Pochonia chlamydosporia 170]|uniref:Six-bladed beta-propeller, TolB-like protein n=1 Tax=Pochonia chlamydosporia 170 TaxID=1380566 RepID=A0A179G4K2_METCM|nr:six-bladed beta-propeller, TolB-like protein [Pochonia chlamydosporia 170]OAQ72776.1 six-bladed beta-propeller, TolB-like protein [Pochonia chlamydosporia 170]